MLRTIILKAGSNASIPSLSRQNKLLRFFATAGAVSRTSPGSIKKIFDDNSYWRNINGQDANNSKISQYLFKKNKTGLFKNPYLTSPDGLRKFSQVSLQQAQELLDKMRNDFSESGKLTYIMNLDRLSDTLCRVIDLCEFIRSTHPDDAFVRAAQDCHEQMFEFMNVLNTDVSLCNMLKSVLNNPEVSSKLSAEELKVGKILLDDFEKSGIYMNPDIREKFIQLSQEISLVGQEFINHTDYPGSNSVKIPCKDLDNSKVSTFLLKQLNKDVKGQNYKVPTFGYAAYALLKSCENEMVRKKLWTALHSCSDKQVKRLSHLIKLRAILANLMHKTSYAEYQLEGKMAKNPKDVQDFILTLMNNTIEKTANELKFIAELKAKDLKKPLTTNTDEILKLVRPWDRDYYTGKYLQLNPSNSPSAKEISYYFTLGNVIQGLSDLFQQIYGIRLEPAITDEGETWSPDVRRLNVISEEEGIIGIIYCDLFERNGKTSNPAHFTVCCSRQIYPSETDFSTIQVGENPDGTYFQLPVISLVCNFSPILIASKKSLCFLQLSEVETLFHEMGHAMHSMLGRTHMQNISGTRCATDFVELPSILMEHFAKDIRILTKIGKHYGTGETIQADMLQRFMKSTNFLQNCETYSQAKMAMLDQSFHDEKIISDIDNFDVVENYQALERRLKVLVDDQSNWCGRFGHLFGYGATYYSYLFDRMIASKIWYALFEDDPYSRKNGDKFKKHLLKWGGLKDPWKCIADVLECPMLEKGGSDAMEFIAQSHKS
ncbi:1-Oct [Saccharomyces cerevisiae]|nr:1-Oct [Saccharomyces cerevisiae]